MGAFKGPLTAGARFEGRTFYPEYAAGGYARKMYVKVIGRDLALPYRGERKEGETATFTVRQGASVWDTWCDDGE